MPVTTTLDIVATAHGVEVPAAPHLRPGMIASINEGKYERHEIALGLAAIPQGARILEMGAGSGFVGAVLARNTHPQALLSVEGNPDLIPHIQALHAHNGLDHLLTLRHGVVLTAPDAPETMRFFIGGNFLGSGLAEQKPDRMRPVDVPVIRYASLTAEFPHDAIMMDIEGGELDFLRHADLSGVQTFIAEMHPAVYGREGMAECRALLVAAGLTQDDRSRAGVYLYRRT
ncbi:MAG: FkbM family methyltransferase [Paracoccaceae bacterium]